MFEDFERKADPRTRRRLFASTGASIALYAAIAGALIAVAGNEVRKERKPPPLEVTFRKPAPPPPAPPPPPPPPPKPTRRKAKIAGNAPSTPQAIPEQDLAQGDEDDFLSQLATVGTDAVVQAGGLLEATPPPAPPRRRPAPPLDLPEDVAPPVALDDNARPVYPPDARRAGREGVVVLTFRVTADGAVDDIEVVAGEEPFVAAALAAVRTWRYRPARVADRPAAVYRQVRLPFTVRARS